MPPRRWPQRLLLGARVGLLATACACATQPAPVTKVVNGRVIVTRAVSAQAYEHAARALLLADAERWDEAIGEYRRALSYDDDAPELHARLAEVLIRDGRLPDAEAEVAASLKIEPTPAGLLAQAHLAEQRADAARAVAAIAAARPLVSFSEDPNEAETVWLELADAQLLALDLAGAGATLRELCDAYPQSLGGRMRAAALAWSEADTATAESRLKEVLGIEPSMLEAVLQLAQLRASLERNEDARAAFQDALDRSEGAPEVATPFARWMVGRGELTTARQMVDELASVDVNEDNVFARMELERTVKRGDRALALAARLRRDEPSAEVKERLTLAEAVVLDEAGRTAEAVKSLLAMPVTATNFARARLTAADLLVKRGQMDAAAAALNEAQTAARQHPESAPSLDAATVLELAIAQAQVDVKRGDFAAAARRLDERLAAQPTSSKLLLARAAVEDQRGQWRPALAFAERVLARELASVEALNFWGFVAADHDEQVTRALARLRVASTFEPASAAILDSVGWAYLRAGDLARAGVLLEGAGRLAGDDAEILSHVGALYARRGDKARAVSTLRRALGHDPEPPVRRRIEEQLRALDAREAAGR